MKIVNVWDFSGGIECAIQYFHAKWGSKVNYNFYYDAISHSCSSPIGLPRFYLLLDKDVIVGCYALLVNDLVSRQDLLPWIACLYVEPSYRGRALGSILLKDGIEKTANLGYSCVYLTTDHSEYYEKYGWERIQDAYNYYGEQGRVYQYCIPHSTQS
ncbi:MAG: GNAT family N-acetyltransferase [Candidatus Cloacimonetes bacterium]|nr:GNAT family N-acetyltransferase [Candidatus Cloacimonadota bacterium]MDD4687038.1 GNAT family N-acetyltransferase [Candidatus Cloacimonadota bacterium]